MNWSMQCYHMEFNIKKIDLAKSLLPSYYSIAKILVALNNFYCHVQLASYFVTNILAS